MKNKNKINDNDVDILDIDNKIILNFREEEYKLSKYKNNLEELKINLELKNIRPRIIESLTNTYNDLKKHINDIEGNISLYFYITESALFLEKYKEILKTPMKVNFLGKDKKNNKEKNKIIVQYLEIANKYVDIDIVNNSSLSSLSDKDKITCNTCKNKKDFTIVDNNIYICQLCSTQQVILKNISSYRDIDRVNISSKYMYDRKIHFRDCINQYQGKQNSTIEPKVYEELEKQFELHHLLVGTINTEKIKRFANITKEHINMFLKELGYTKHYENVNLIHYNITDIKPDNISHLENRLLEDFDILTEVYDILFKDINRKNFINTQYILFQLLKRYKHPCNIEDFDILKTIERKTFHDDIFRVLASHLCWNFTSTL